MKKLLCLISILFLGFNVTHAQSEEAAINAVLQDFLEGGTNGEVARFKGAFFSDAIQKTVGKNGVTGMTVESLVSKIKEGQKMDRTTKVISWTQAGTAATAVTETDYSTSKIIDLLNLLKVNDQWKIVSRVYSRIEKDEIINSSAPMAKPGKAGATAAKPAPKKKPASDDGW